MEKAQSQAQGRWHCLLPVTQDTALGMARHTVASLMNPTLPGGRDTVVGETQRVASSVPPPRREAVAPTSRGGLGSHIRVEGSGETVSAPTVGGACYPAPVTEGREPPLELGRACAGVGVPP